MGSGGASSPPAPPRRLPAPRVYLITDRAAIGERALVETVRRALDFVARPPPGADLRPDQVAVQLREKDLGGGRLLELARGLRDVVHAAGARLFVNERVDVALAAAADGVHLGRGALAPGEVHAIAPKLAIALSTHSLDEVARAARDPAVAFVVFGPVFDTPSKRRLGVSPVGLAALGDASRAAVPVVALGGIDATRAGDCARAGAAGVACIRSVLGATDPARALDEMWRKCGGNFRNPLDT